jgi:hypothetical protein
MWWTRSILPYFHNPNGIRGGWWEPLAEVLWLWASKSGFSKLKVTLQHQGRRKTKFAWHNLAVVNSLTINHHLHHQSSLITFITIDHHHQYQSSSIIIVHHEYRHSSSSIIIVNHLSSIIIVDHHCHHHQQPLFTTIIWIVNNTFQFKKRTVNWVFV